MAASRRTPACSEHKIRKTANSWRAPQSTFTVTSFAHMGTIRARGKSLWVQTDLRCREIWIAPRKSQQSFQPFEGDAMQKFGRHLERCHPTKRLEEVHRRFWLVGNVGRSNGPTLSAREDRALRARAQCQRVVSTACRRMRARRVSRASPVRARHLPQTEPAGSSTGGERVRVGLRACCE